MALNVPTVKKFLTASPDLISIIPTSNIYGYKISDNDIDVVPAILITDIRASFTNFAGDAAGGRYRTVQVQAWFAGDDDNIETVELLINSIMESNRWYCSYDGGVSVDPDTSQLMITMQFSHNELK